MTMHEIICPSCGGKSIRSNTLGEQIRLVAIDPYTGTLTEGMPVQFIESDGPVKIYLCVACDYKNVVPKMFVLEVSDVNA